MSELKLTEEHRTAILWAIGASRFSNAPEVVTYHKTFHALLAAQAPTALEGDERAAFEPRAWLVEWPSPDGNDSETWFAVFINERDALDCAKKECSEITPLYAALASRPAVSEPVAFVNSYELAKLLPEDESAVANRTVGIQKTQSQFRNFPLYAAPQPAQPALELLHEIAALKRNRQPSNPNCRSAYRAMVNIPDDLLDRMDALLVAAQPASGEKA